MATTKPRVSVTLDPEMYAALRELADMNGESMSAVIGGLLEVVAPTVLRVVEAGRQFQALSAEMQDQARSSFARAEQTIAPVVADLTEQAFAALAVVPATENDPRPVTRGSRPPSKQSPHEKSGPET